MSGNLRRAPTTVQESSDDVAAVQENHRRGNTALLFGSLAAGLGDVLVGQTTGMVLGVGVGIVAGCVAQGLAGFGVGALWGAKSAVVTQFFRGSIMLPALYCAAIGLAVMSLMKSVHKTWKQGLATAQVAYDNLHSMAKPLDNS